MAKTPKWNGPQGSDDMEKDPIRRENKNSWKTTDISRKVDEAHKIDGGFSGRLPNND
jgi:hypothetical protein